MPDHDVGREAAEMLAAWGLTMDAVRTSTANELNAVIKGRMSQNQRRRFPRVHILNLVALGKQAADAVLANLNPKTNEGEWGEL